MSLDSVLKEFSKNPSPSLYLREKSVGDSDAKKIAQVVSKSSSLSNLILPKNKIGDSGAKALAEALVSSSVTALDLSDNKIGAAGVSCLTDLLVTNKTLTAIHLGGNNITQKGAAYLRLALDQNNTLTSLDLPNSKLNDEGLAHIAHGLRNNSSLTKLNLSTNEFSAEGAKQIANALWNNTSLASLSLSYNKIGDVGAVAFAEALEKNAGLTSLDLYACGIEVAGGLKLASAMERNKSLSSLSFSDVLPKLGDQTQERLKQLLLKNADYRRVVGVDFTTTIEAVKAFAGPASKSYLQSDADIATRASQYVTTFLQDVGFGTAKIDQNMNIDSFMKYDRDLTNKEDMKIREILRKCVRDVIGKLSVILDKVVSNEIRSLSLCQERLAHLRRILSGEITSPVQPRITTNQPQTVTKPQTTTNTTITQASKPETSVNQDSKAPQSPSTTTTNSQGYSSNFSGEWKLPSSLIEAASAAVDQTFEVKFGHQVYLSLVGELKDRLVDVTGALAGYDISKVEYINDVGAERVFHASIEKVEKREKEPIFQPALDIESSPKERERVLLQLHELARKVKHNRSVKILKVYHGTSSSLSKKIVDTGFANLAKLDDGWYGKGIYFTTHPEYALRYCRDKDDPCLVISFVILSNPYPLVIDDAPSQGGLKFVKRANYKNYGSHYVPVVKYGSSATSMDYRPPPIGGKHLYDEVVIFNEGHILNQFIVHLKPRASSSTTTKINSSPTKKTEDWSVDEVIAWTQKLNLSKDYAAVLRENNINGKVLKTMSKEDWKEIGITVFGDLRILSQSESLFVL
eukprot:TRINITY_DN1024_c0_g2_i1.p1 TRINITY_DN1024_c0_g2~~TRINITY_DN1024_c0_g2_i1.p1  ORF type:complete len:803 (+),score=220.76 TRINITY_DN1024_c0_g2_i1:98-2506(+)